DEEYTIQYREYLEKSPDAVTTVLPTEEPEYSLSMGYEHLSTTPETELDEVTESSTKNLLTSSDDESLPDEDVPTEEFKVYSNPLFDDEEISSNKIDPHCFNVESYLIESLLNRDTFIDSSPKFDFLLKEYSGELAHINPTLPEIKEADFDFEEEIRLIENLLYDNSSPRPLEELNAEITNTIVESLPSSLIPVQDNDSQREEIDIDDPSFPRPPPEPPDAEFDFEPNSREVILAAMNNNDELNEDECFDPGGEINVFANDEDDDYFPFMFVIRIFLPYLIYPEVSPLLLSVESEDTIFDPGISV
nr:hypothetical protein [Tanacetum cinerariifolium]